MSTIQQHRNAGHLLRNQPMGLGVLKFFALSAMGFSCGIVLALGGLHALKALLERSSRVSFVAESRAMSRNVNAHALSTRSSEAASDSQGEHTVGYRGEVNASAANEVLRQKTKAMQEGLDLLSQVNTYTAKARKQEFVDGKLLEPQVILLKCRAKPFSVYGCWVEGDVGREVIYVEGENDNKVIGHDGGWKSKIPALVLDPNCRLAMLDTRYPVTKGGIAGLAETMLQVHLEDLQRGNVASCTCDADEQFEGRPCAKYTTIYKSQTDSPVYRKSVTFLDQEWKIPVHSTHFEWPQNDTSYQSEAELDENTLIEDYSFSDISMGCSLSDNDFDPKNPEYNFR